MYIENSKDNNVTCYKDRIVNIVDCNLSSENKEKDMFGR